jgi:hypothetical protein
MAYGASGQVELPGDAFGVEALLGQVHDALAQR